MEPVVFFKMLLVGYLNNINNDRALLRHCSNCLDVRLFLSNDLDEDLPWHSTIPGMRPLPYSSSIMTASWLSACFISLATPEWAMVYLSAKACTFLGAFGP
ncbi:MAG TPA: transposase [Aquaticitalea sp.]|nr:transposase [Aquaticitalea sp.]